MRNLRILALAALSTATLIGCSNGEFLYGKALGDLSTIAGVDTRFSPKEEPKAATELPPGPPLIVGFEAIRVALPYAGESGASKTYTSPDGVDMAMTGTFVTRATGLGIDMQANYLPADSAWFSGLSDAAKAGATSDRVVEYWEKNRMKRDKYSCALSETPRPNGGSVIDETCKRYFEPVSFTNRYWLTADNAVECSRQWINPKLSPLQFFSTEQQALTLDLTEGGC